MTVEHEDVVAGSAPDGTERPVFGPETTEEIHAFLDEYARQQLGSGITRVRFRAGRIDAVWGVELGDGRTVVIKTHRPPAEVEALRATAELKRVLVAANFPCPTPLSGPDEVDGHVVTVETLVAGGLSAPEDVANVMRDYDAARARPLSDAEQRTAVAAAAWICAFYAPLAGRAARARPF